MFSPPESFYNVVRVHSCALADTDNDMDLDVIAAGPNAGQQLVVLPNDGDGNLGEAQLITPVTDPFNIETADMDGDGVLDLVRRGYREVAIYRGTGNGLLFQGYSPSAFAEYPLSVGRIDADERPDVLTIHPELNVVEVMLATGSGGLAPPDTATGIINDASKIAAGDLDDDGDRDLVIGSSSIRVFFTRTEPGGVFVPGDPVFTSNDDNVLAIAEFDGDGDLDVLIGGAGDFGGAALYRNEGAFVFSSSGINIPQGTLEFLVGDLDGDGDLDVVDRNYWVFAHANDGVGGFISTGNPIDMDGESVDVALGDFDGDGDLDVVNLLATSVRVLENDGAGGFEIAGEIAVGQSPTALALLDLDLDDDLDVAVATAVGVETLVNTGRAALAEGFNLPMNAPLDVLASGDLDGDGDADLAGLDRAGHRLQIMTSAGDTTLDLGPVFAATDTPNDLVIADINGDCAPDIAVTRFESEAASVLFARP
jgi:hypothetical protein